MGFNTPFLNENTPSSLNDFGWFKVQRHTKTVLVEMLKTFFDRNKAVYSMSVPEITKLQNSDTTTNVYIEKNFPYEERKIPLIAISQVNAREKKTFIGIDNYSHTRFHYNSSSGEMDGGTNFYSGISEVDSTFIIVGLSSEQRSQLSEFINVCFTHYFRWQYFFYGPDGSMFSILPSTKELSFGTESEITSPSDLEIVYITTVTLSSFIEYKFREFSKDNIPIIASNIEFGQNPETGEYSGVVEF